MFTLSVTPDFLAYLLAGISAILFDWFPGLSSWFGNLTSLKKQQIMATLLLAIILLIYLGSCTGILAAGFTCDKTGFAALFQVYLISVGINQGVHLLSKPGQSVPGMMGNTGQGMVEYALILVLVAIVVITVLTVMGPLISNVFSTINASL